MLVNLQETDSISDDLSESEQKNAADFCSLFPHEAAVTAATVATRLFVRPSVHPFMFS